MSKEAAAEDELACLQREARETAAAMLVADRFASLIQAVSVACAKLAVRSTFSKERLLSLIHI